MGAPEALSEDLQGMSRPLKLSLALVALFLALVTAPVTAEAWLFSADVLIHKVGVVRRNMKVDESRLTSLEVRGRLELVGDGARSAAAFFDKSIDEDDPRITLASTASYRFPGRCRIEAIDGGSDGKRLSASSNNGTNAFENAETPIAILEMFTDMACPLLDGRGGYDGPLALVRRAGVKRTFVTLGRAEDRHIAYVIGAKPTDANASSLWVSKDTFQPLRLVDRRAQTAREVRLVNYDSPQSGRWHPRRIEFFQEGRLIGTFFVDAATPNPRLNNAIF